MIFEFKAERVFTNSLDVDDIGNMCVRATDSNQCDYYIMTQTVMGKTNMLTFGPIMPDIDEAIPGFFLSYNKMDYDEKKITKAVTMFLNDVKRGITEATNVDSAEAFSMIPTYDKFMTL